MYPDSNPITCIFAHSMGGVIIWDILNQTPVEGVPLPTEKLQIPIPSIFLVGSPVSKLLVFRGHSIQQYQHTVRFYSLYHPLDPVAYRLEPIFDPRLQALPPVEVPRYFKPLLNDFQKKLDQFQQWMGSSQKRPHSPSPPHLSPASPTSTRHHRHYLHPKHHKHHKLRKHSPNSFSKSLSWTSLKEVISFKFISTSEKPKGTVVRSDHSDEQVNELSDLSPISIIDSTSLVKEDASLLHLLPYRMDFCLAQTTFSFSMTTYFSAVFSHFAYWDNSDAASFILSHVSNQNLQTEVSS
ncbi:Phospholipase ddhd1 [Coelomomyces lativittatus]|nr:Phospholipase ddhd1 [Coelomomyces lativittatus]